MKTSPVLSIDTFDEACIRRTEPQEEEEEEEEVVEEGEISGKISGLAQDTAVVLPPDFLLTFQTIRRVKSDEVSDITRQLQRLEEYQNLEE
ncbi:hypothetical protein Pcinc_001112 [Petrolisthes cinctipes]|uniref:Uncharacterized protein n=1 Tax=Petrolisthes cinctipes TaxID=88211 RepID=A0AAE1L3M8_PETCI|nr:hypothetical protein Pcinc_001112 [Petrolisthes cinctipes]